MIGDGMGLTQISAARFAKGTLAMDRFPTVGLLATQSTVYITDSAAGATAMASGVTTYNGAIGVGPDGKPVETALEAAQDKGMQTGLVVTCTITHATPACFIAHESTRAEQFGIARDIADHRADVVFGGGRKFFRPLGIADGAREDDLDLVAQMQSTGYSYLTRLTQLDSLPSTGKLLGLFATEHLDRMPARGPALEQMSMTAVERLGRAPNGFFLMIEGSQIDWGGHANDSAYAIRETVDFDNAIGKVLDWAEQDGNTLVIVTADHETGGMALNQNNANPQSPTVAWTTKHHTGTMVQVFAAGPGSEVFRGVHRNTLVGQAMLEYIRRR